MEPLNSSLIMGGEFTVYACHYYLKGKSDSFLKGFFQILLINKMRLSDNKFKIITYSQWNIVLLTDAGEPEWSKLE